MTGNALRSAALMAVLITLFALIGQALGGTTGLLLAFGIAVALNFASYWFSDRIVLRMYKGREIFRTDAPELYDMVDRLRQRADLPMPRVVLIPSPQPNAFATGRNPENAAVAFTEGILRALPADELAGVTAHELAHIKHRDILTSSVAATLGSAITLLARFAIFVPMGGNRDGGNALQGLLLMILAPIAAVLIQMAISRAREFEADRGGAEISGDPMALARALVRLERGAEAIPAEASPSTSHMFIVNPFSGAMGGIAGLFRTHPPTDDRVARLEALATGR
ncbi:MAG: zinc metalloprotease HtpX [Bacteroidota bacterium]